METYQDMKKRHSDEFGAFEGVFFAFSDEQLAEGMQKLGLAEKDYKAIVSIGAGGYVKRDRISEFNALFKRQAQERKDLRKDETKMVDALCYELSNHEYVITGNPEDALNALGLTMNTVPENVLKRAIKKHNELVIV